MRHQLKSPKQSKDLKKINELFKKQDVKNLCFTFFGQTITKKQEEIVRSIAFKKHDRIVIISYTRYGKSMSVAMAACLYIIGNTNKNINIISPKFEQSTIIRNYISQFILECTQLRDIIDIDTTGIDRLKKEVSKKRLTFKNGCELRIMSAEGTADRLMGWGGDLIILDESDLIADEVYRQKISRMLGDNVDTQLVEISNPWNRGGHLDDHWQSPRFHQIHVNWKDGVREGRISEKFVEEQRAELSPIEFQILYEAEFPDESEDQLIPWKHIKPAIGKKFAKVEYNRIVYGMDVAEMGRDKNVLTKVETSDVGVYNVLSINEWSKVELMPTTGKIMAIIGESDIINVDATGLGSGVYSRLKEQGYNVKKIIVGSAPNDRNDVTRKKKADRFQNKKAEYFWTLRALFEAGKISIPNHPTLIKELTKMKWEFSSAKKIKIIDPSDKSPDFADSLMLACIGKPTGVIMGFL